MIIDDFAYKLDMAIRQKGITQAELAERVGVTPRHLSRVKTAGGRVADDLLKGICDSLDLPQSFFTGEPASANDDYYPVPLREAGGGMGGGMVSGSKKIISYISLRRDFLLTKTSNLDGLSFIHAKGDSMSPTITDGAAVLIDEGQTEPVNGKIFYMLLNNDYLIKRLEAQHGKVTAIISDNGAIREELGSDDHLQILGKALLQQTLL